MDSKSLTFVMYHESRSCCVYLTQNPLQASRLVCCIDCGQLSSVFDTILSVSGQWSLQIAAEIIDFTASSTVDSESLKLIQDIHDRIELLKQRGISIMTIRHELLKFQRPSHLELTSDYRLILTDYNNLEIHLKPLAKALYILFLRHPEGVILKRLADYSAELVQIYSKVAPTRNPQQISKGVSNVCNPLHNSVNEKIAQIRSSISDMLDEDLASLYIIKGEKGQQYSISLPRELLK